MSNIFISRESNNYNMYHFFKIKFSIKIIFLLFISICWGQWFSINHDSITRYYYMSYPSDSDFSDPPALIINMHGYGGNPQNQLSSSEMDSFAHPRNIAVVYPQGAINGWGIAAWNIGTFWDQSNLDDVGFISLMIDQISNDFEIDLDRVYACGMSNGGYMAYELACELEDKIAAFGSVTGNFMLNTSSGQICEFTREVPIAHFHGTADSTVDYYPPTFDQALAVSESIDFWSEYNDLNLEYIYQLNENVEIYKYYNQDSVTEFLHYKVYGGGHTWFKENWGFHTSEELINFFLNYRLSDFFDEGIIGDINNDLTINILDVILLVDLILDDIYLDDGDINNDQFLDILDIVEMVNIILN